MDEASTPAPNIINSPPPLPDSPHPKHTVDLNRSCPAHRFPTAPVPPSPGLPLLPGTSASTANHDDGTTTPHPHSTAIAHSPPRAPPSPHPKRIRRSSAAESAAVPVADIIAPGHHHPSLLPLSSSSNGTMTASTPSAVPAPSLQVQLLDARAQAPTRGSAFAAGYDLYSAESASVPARGKAMVSTGISIAVPEGTYGRVAPRSGLAAKHSIHTGAGVIDADYRGEVKVILFNLGDADFAVKQGDRIAQLIVERIYTPEVVVVEKLEASVRGAGGFGSTGGFGAAVGSLAPSGAEALNGP